MSIYKYFSVTEYTLKNLMENKICFNSIENFNDPFEGYGKFTIDVGRGGKEYFDSINMGDIEEKFARNLGERLQEAVNQKKRILCLTEDYNNPLMWAHYADSHKGFCVEYRQADLEKLNVELKRVEYCERPDQIDLSALDNKFGNEEMKKVEKLLFCKSKEWSYEKEWRALLTVDKASIDKKYILKPCPPCSIYLGVKMNDYCRDFFVTLCEEKKIPVYRMIQRDGTFSLEADQL